MADRYAAHPDLLPLGLERGGLRVAETEAQEFHLLIERIQERAAGEYIYATPDSPVVYFLAEKRNPTRTFYDLMDVSEGRIERIVEALDRHRINVVVINAGPVLISPPPLPRRSPRSWWPGILIKRKSVDLSSCGGRPGEF